MVNPLTLDSSIIVAALREEEEKHERCRDILERTKNKGLRPLSTPIPAGGILTLLEFTNMAGIQ